MSAPDNAPHKTVAFRGVARLRRHPRHVCLAMLVAGLLGAGAHAVAVVVGAVAVPLLGLAGFKLRVALTAAILVLAGALAGSARLAAIDRSPLAAEVDHAVRVRGFLVKRERPTGWERRARLRVTALERPGGGFEAMSDLVQLRLPKRVPLPSYFVGDEAVVAGVLERPASRPGADFDYAGYLHRAGVHAELRADSLALTGRRRAGVAGVVDSFRRRAERGVAAGLHDPIAALALGLVLGQDERIPGQMSDQFKASGLAHLLAVSGQNVTLLAILAVAVLGTLGCGRRTRLLGALVLIGVYVPLTGAGPSILRAGAMGAAGLLAALAGRPASRWYAMLVAATFTLALDPRAWLDAGWQLSFAAVVGIFWAAGPLGRLLGARLPEPVALGAAMTLAATLATAPLIAFHFGRLSVVSVLANLIALPVVAPVMWLGMLAALAGQVSTAPAVLVNGVTGYPLAYLAAVARWSAGLPHSVLELRLGSPLALAAVYALVGGVTLALRRAAPQEGLRVPSVRRAIAVASLVALTVFAAAVASGRSRPSVPPGRLTVSFLDVGQGDATLIETPAGAVLVDAGPAEARIASKLRAAGVRSLALAALTHPQADHEDGFEDLLRRLPVGVLLDGGYGAPVAVHRRIARLARRRGTRVIVARAGQVLRLGELRVSVLSPPRGYAAAEGGEINDRAAVLLASFRGFDVFLPADAESNVTSRLPLARVEVLKVAHHGSEDAGLAGILDRLRPQVAVIEVGARNRFGHPTKRTLETLSARVPRVLRTDLDGDVRISFGAAGPTVSTAR